MIIHVGPGRTKKLVRLYKKDIGPWADDKDWLKNPTGFRAIRGRLFKNK